MPRTIEQLVAQQLGAQALRIAQLQLENDKLQEEAVALRAEVASLRQNHQEPSDGR